MTMTDDLEMIRKAMDELGDAVTGLQVKHRGRIVLLHPTGGDPRGAWATMVDVDAGDDDDDDTELALGYGETVQQALDEAVDQAVELEEQVPR